MLTFDKKNALVLRKSSLYLRLGAANPAKLLVFGLSLLPEKNSFEKKIK